MTTPPDLPIPTAQENVAVRLRRLEEKASREYARGGGAGTPGDPGTDGRNAGVPYDWSTTTSETDPTSGRIRVNHATFASATEMYISEEDLDTRSTAEWLRLFDDSTSTVKGFLVMRNLDNSLAALVEITGAITDNGTWVSVPINPLYSTQASGFPSGTDILLQFYAKGDKGDTGDTGPAGADADDGAPGQDAVAGTYATDIGNGSSTSIAVGHGLGSRDVIVTVFDNSTFDRVDVDVDHTDANTVTLAFAVAPTTNQYRVVVLRGGAPAGGPNICEGRLTTETGVGVSTSDRTAQSTLYFTPFRGNRVSLYNGSAWAQYTFSERSIALSGLTASRPYDVFLYDNAGTLTLELVSWTNDTTRATALALQDGILVKSGATGRRYLGTIYTTGTTTTEDSRAKRLVWNYYNRAPRPMRIRDLTNSWTYATASWRQARGQAANQAEFVIGVAEDAVSASLQALMENTTGTEGSCSIGLDSTTAKHEDATAGSSWTANETVVWTNAASLETVPAAGWHRLVWLERASNGSITFYGETGVDSQYESGLRARVLA